MVKTLGEKMDKMQETFKENSVEEEVWKNSTYPADRVVPGLGVSKTTVSDTSVAN